MFFNISFKLLFFQGFTDSAVCVNRHKQFRENLAAFRQDSWTKVAKILGLKITIFDEIVDMEGSDDCESWKRVNQIIPTCIADSMKTFLILLHNCFCYCLLFLLKSYKQIM